MIDAVKWWLLKTVGSIALSAPVIWGGAYWISDYVSDKHAKGLTVAVEGLHTSVSDLNSTVVAINAGLSEQLIGLERQRSALAIEIAREVMRLDGAQSLQGKDIEFLRNALTRIEKTIGDISSSTKVRITFDGGRTFETYAADDAIAKFAPDPIETPAYAIVPWSTYALDTTTGRIDLSPTKRPPFKTRNLFPPAHQVTPDTAQPGRRLKRPPGPGQIE